MPNVEVTGLCAAFRAKSVLTAGLGSLAITTDRILFNDY